jgi:hypothetical protein
MVTATPLWKMLFQWVFVINIPVLLSPAAGPAQAAPAPDDHSDAQHLALMLALRYRLIQLPFLSPSR